MFTSILDILHALIQERKTIVWITMGMVALSIILSFIIPIKYRAVAVLMPPSSQGANIMTLMGRGNLISDPEIGGTGYLPGVVTPSDVYAYILESSPVKEIVIRECSLVEHYKKSVLFASKPDQAMFDVVNQLKKSTRIKVTETKFITISVEDKSRVQAAEIANKYGEALDRVYIRMTMNQGGNMREFIEKRLAQEDLSSKQAEDSLKTFQQRYRTVSLSDEMKAMIEMSAQIDAKIISQQIELDALKNYSSSDNIQVKVLENQIEKSKNELNTLLNGDQNETLFTPFYKIPVVAQRLAQLSRNVRIHQELYMLLVQQLEQAKILEAKDTPKVQFLERAMPPYKKYWPKRSLIWLMGLMLGLIASTGGVLSQKWWRMYLNQTDNGTRIKEMIRLISNRQG